MSYWRLVEPYWDVVSIYDGGGAFLSAFSAIPEPSQHLFAAHWVQSEVRNGGFSQLFHNSTGVLAPEAAHGFRTIGMPRAAAILEEAMRWLGEPYPREREKRREVLEALEEGHDAEHFDDCVVCSADERFWDHLNEEAGGFEVAADRYAERFA